MKMLSALRDFAIVVLVALAGYLVIDYVTSLKEAVPPPLGDVLPNPYDADHFEIPEFQVFKTEDGVWRVATPVLPPSMPIRMYLVVLDEGLKGKIKLKPSSFVARHVPGVGWESPVREVVIRDFSDTSRGHAAVIEIHGFVRRYGVVFDLDFSGLDKEPGFDLSMQSFALIAEKAGKELEKTGVAK